MSDQLTIDELRAYQAGLLSGPDRHRVERLLRENPFYADALEGLEALQLSGKSLTKHSTDLRQSLQERIHESATEHRLMPLWMTSAAASIFLVMSVAIYLIYFMKPAIAPVTSSKPMVFEVELTPAKPAATPVQEPKNEQVAQVAKTTQPKQQLPKRLRAETLAAPVVARVDKSTAPLHDVAVVANETSMTTDVVTAQKTVADSVMGQFKLTPTASASMGRSRENPKGVARVSATLVKSVDQRYVTGIITDSQNKPLPGVTVLINNTKRGTITDTNGQFRLDSLAQHAQLTAAYIGFQQKIVSVSDLAKGPIQLQEDTGSLSEVVMTGYNTQKKKATQPASLSASSPSGMVPAPVMGNFDEFVLKNRQLPAEAMANAIHGRVMVRFKVQKDRSIRRIQIKQSLGHGLDEEALRLIRSYPNWPNGWQEARVDF